MLARGAVLSVRGEANLKLLQLKPQRPGQRFQAHRSKALAAVDPPVRMPDSKTAPEAAVAQHTQTPRVQNATACTVVNTASRVAHRLCAAYSASYAARRCQTSHGVTLHTARGRWTQRPWLGRHPCAQQPYLQVARHLGRQLLGVQRNLRVEVDIGGVLQLLLLLTDGCHDRRVAVAHAHGHNPSYCLLWWGLGLRLVSQCSKQGVATLPQRSS